jgi:NSS family neurotransmitter:Na+ symporter
MPTLFQNWGPILAVVAGVAWFGLLFFAGVTSSLAMGTPWMGFMKDEFNWSNNKSALTLGLVVLVLAMPTILFYQAGVFGEYDFWTGTVSLVIFAFVEVVLFAWVFGMDKGWREITDGADIRVPLIYKFIIKYVTPLFIGIVLVSAFFKVSDGALAPESVVGMIFHVGVEDTRWFIDGVMQNIFLIDMSRILLVLTFLGLAFMVKIASNRRKKAKK